MTFLSSIEWFNTGLHIWADGLKYPAVIRTSAKIISNAFFALVWLLLIVWLAVLGSPDSTLSLMMMLDCAALLIVGSFGLVLISRNKINSATEWSLLLSFISISSSIALPTLLCLFVGPYALVFFLWPLVATITETLIKSALSLQRMWASIIGLLSAMVAMS